jgi:hypothetical protein
MGKPRSMECSRQHGLRRKQSVKTDGDCSGGKCVLIDGGGTSGYPCRDQIGRGKDNATTGVQAAEPVVLWNNRWCADLDTYSDGPFATGVSCSLQAASVNAATIGAGMDTVIVANQDFCQAATQPASCNSIEFSYTPYTCPHPLTGLTEGCNAATAGTAGYNTEVEDPPDTTAPEVTAFTVPSSNVGYVVPVTLTCTDAIGVTGWCLVETDSYGGCLWPGATITSKTFTTQGAKTLYAFCRDGSGNVSASSTDSVTVTSGRGSTALLGTGSVVRIGTGSEFTVGTSSGTQGP